MRAVGQHDRKQHQCAIRKAPVWPWLTWSHAWSASTNTYYDQGMRSAMSGLARAGHIRTYPAYHMGRRAGTGG